MINKILIKAIIEQLLVDTFHLTLLHYTYEIKKRSYGYEIQITALQIENNMTITKNKTIQVIRWVELIINYDHVKSNLKKDLVENFKESEYE